MTHYDRCRIAVQSLNTAESWELSEQAVDEYAVKLVTLVGESNPDTQLLLRVKQYHRDRVLVQALLDPGDVGHGKAWEEIFTEIARIVYWRKGEKEHILLEADDLIQIAHINVIKSVKTFRFNSLFSTWLTRVVINSIRQAKRDESAKGRNVPTDQLEDAIPDHKHQMPEEKTDLAVLLGLIRQILEKHRDVRLIDIFVLAEVKNIPIREIAPQFHLHPSRIRALLVQAKNILRADPSIHSWKLALDQRDSSENRDASSAKQ